jgi:hypothetical protein
VFRSSKLAAAAADEYFQSGFTVALEDVVEASNLGDYRTMIRSRPCHVVVLDDASDSFGYGDAKSDFVEGVLRSARN